MTDCTLLFSDERGSRERRKRRRVVASRHGYQKRLERSETLVSPRLFGLRAWPKRASAGNTPPLSPASRANILSERGARASFWLTSKLCLVSSGRTRGEMEQLVLMKQLQDTNYYVNVLLLSSAAANSLVHLEVQSLPCVRVCVFPFSFLGR